MTTMELTKFDPVKHNSLCNIKSTSKISIIILIFHLMGMPLIILSAMYNITHGLENSASEWAALIGCGVTGIAGAAGIIITLMNYRYLYNKSQVDMCLSQPLTRKQRFLSDFFSGLISYVAPFIAASVVSVILLLIGNATLEGKTFQVAGSTTGETYICDFFTAAFEYAPRIFLFGIAAMLMLFTLTLLVAVCCGSLFESILYTVFTNVAIPLVIYLVYIFNFEGLYGIDLEIIPTIGISCTSPAGVIFVLATQFDDEYFLSSLLPEFIIGYVIVMAVMFVGAYFLYMKRKAEQVSRPFVFKGLFHAIITAITICITAAFVYNGLLANIVPMFLVTFIVYMILEIVANRGFKQIWKGIIRYAVTIGVYIGFVAILNSTNCFGVITKIPDISDISSVSINYGGIFGQYPYTYQGDYYGIDIGKYDLYEEENIQAVLNVHQEIINSYLRDKDYDNTSTFVSTESITICYNLKDGRKMVRGQYSFDSSNVMNELMTIDLSQEVRKQASEYYKTQFPDSYDYVVERGYQFNERSLPFYASGVIETGEGYEGPFYPEREFYVRLGNALATDILSISDEDYYKTTGENAYIISVGEFGTHIDNNYTETIRLLENYGFLPEINKETVAEMLQSNEFYESGHIIRILSPEDYKKIMGTDLISTSYRQYYFGNNNENQKFIQQYSDEFAEIATVMSSVYITDEPCYTINIDGAFYVVPPEYTELAEKLYKSAVYSSELLIYI